MTPDGVLVVDKPSGMTSHDVVARARRIFGTRTVGHAGTLDPMATGVLLLLFGEATKLSNFLTNDDKRYRATVCFGRSTDTLDAEGTTTSEASVDPQQLSEARLTQALALEQARERQVPPAVSAIKVDGKRSYALARAGHAPALSERVVRVAELRLLARDGVTVSVELAVSKGYYVRAFARDLGEALGLPAHLSALRRLASGGFDLSLAQQWPPHPDAPLLETATAAAQALPTARLTETGLRHARLGQPLDVSDFAARPALTSGGTEAWLSERGELVALGRESESEPGRFKVQRGFRNPS